MTTDQGDLAHLVGVVENIRYPHNTRWCFPSKVGGKPAWLVPKDIPEVKCDCCEKSMTFLLQIYAPDSENICAFHRSLMAFVCLSCRCLLKVIRVQLPRKNDYYGLEPLAIKHVPLEDHLLEELVCNECGLLAHDSKVMCRPLPEYAIEIDEIDDIVIGEEDDDQDMDDESIETDFDNSAENCIDESEADLFKDFANTAIENDPCFRVFKKFVDEAPTNQVLYYSVGGCPIWITHINQYTSEPPCCEYCKGPRQFEFQIQPQLIYHLMKRLTGYPMSAAPFEWGVVAVYTCKNNCGQGDSPIYREEFVYNQMEPAEWLEFDSRKKVDFTQPSANSPQVAHEDADEGEWM